jgi:hypothetical protein
MKWVGCFIIVASIWAGQSIAYAASPEEGQALFDSVFWLFLQVWVIGLTAGLAIKMINRS